MARPTHRLATATQVAPQPPGSSGNSGNYGSSGIDGVAGSDVLRPDSAPAADVPDRQVPLPVAP
jgi:hypothetical protein